MAFRLKARGEIGKIVDIFLFVCGNDLIGHVRNGNGRNRNGRHAVTRGKLADVVHAAHERLRTRAELGDAKGLDGLDDVRHADKAVVTVCKVVAFDLAVPDVAELDVVAAQDFRTGEHAALRVTAAGLERVGAFVARAPKKRGNFQRRGNGGHALVLRRSHSAG